MGDTQKNYGAWFNGFIKDNYMFLLENSNSFIDYIGIFGVAVFAISGALSANNLRMDPIGFLLLGTVTAIGGGTMRDAMIGRTVFWTIDASQLSIALIASLLTYFFIRKDISQQKWMVWSDALGLAAFTVQGTFIAIDEYVPVVVIVVMGTMTAVGGGVIRDILSCKRPMIFGGQLYASLAVLGSFIVLLLNNLGLPEPLTAAMGFAVVFIGRGATILFNIRTGPPGELLRFGPSRD